MKRYTADFSFIIIFTALFIFVVAASTGGQTAAELPGDSYLVQTGAFHEHQQAEELYERLTNKGFEALVYGEDPYQVYVIAGPTREEAEDISREMREMDLGDMILSPPDNPDDFQEEEQEEEIEEDPDFEPEEEEQPLISMLFIEEPISEALYELMLQTGINIIYDDTVTGTVTLDLEDVPFEEALEMILMQGGYEYQRVEDYYIVGSARPGEPLFRDLTVTETIHLDYISASEAVDLLPPYYEDYVQTSPEHDRTINLVAPPEIVEDFKEDLDRIDTQPREVVIEAVVTEIYTEAFEEYGMDMFGLTTEDEDESYALEFDGAFALEAAGPAGELVSELKLLEEEDMAEIRANPSIRVGEGETAELFVGEERIFIQEVEDEQIQEEIEVGVAMEVTPEIMAEDEIRMSIAPDVSHFTEERQEQLVVRTSQLESVVRATSGETITMAGMTLDEVMEYESAVPVLGDIPLVRWMFREEVEREGEREMLVFITPEIVNDEDIENE